MDHNLLTTLVERWSPQTNSFHLPVGEMTITLQDVALILGLQIDGQALVGNIVVGLGRRWASWSDCCDDLLVQHHERDVVYQDPFNPRVSSKFRMGQDSYLDLNELDFWRHVRAYILFLMGTYLLRDTSGCEIHLRFLPLLEDLGLFNTYSLGGAVLAHLYRELTEATKPKRANIASCIHLLQIWCWERLHVRRPALHVPHHVSLDGLFVGYR
ncbi:Serine/threonine-protein phosphatase 7 long form like [Dendrobium catenatum]|uniref:Serine/threonine-protein phosphatase 7 long form like n=1 Tax=Dendrobium catenatum TaxID=906689 RepID=A0A2I0X5X0_9ASPA|nr:Serine/threonine-protein phosphatase 7 long form like [Dendrobium catenatum]